VKADDCYTAVALQAREDIQSFTFTGNSNATDEWDWDVVATVTRR